MDFRIIAHYVDKGKFPNEIINLPYYEKMVAYACILQNHNEDIEEKVALNPFLKRK
ncbi:hypothetical protein ACTFIN_01510 [Clostridium cagae]|uniref:hypothetical protein n=1 Tax=Clostridium TaxID=1485 RepID=UPI000AAA681E|nr:MULTISPECIES: hypothetical protein [unclassified Clostridium]KAI3344991.1 hypothetical protein CIT17_15360 [Clostridium botulinum]MBY6986408.1 hypothetical protein [Clostridium botulinum]MBY7007855.1 hypothetical protein [Clostridium botulinum]MBY7009052.1 hypothetical protein [Clostridium botulinum]